MRSLANTLVLAADEFFVSQMVFANPGFVGWSRKGDRQLFALKTPQIGVRLQRVSRHS